MTARLKNATKWMATIAMAAMLMLCLAACAMRSECFKRRVIAEQLFGNGDRTSGEYHANEQRFR